MKKTIYVVLVFIAIGLIVTLWHMRVAAGDQDVITTPPVVVDPLTHKQRVWMYTLEYCESNGESNLKIVDSNKRYSYGALQFQMETFMREGKAYGILNKALTVEQAEVLIFDTQLQEKIAHQMLLNGGESNWYTCWKRELGAPYPDKISTPKTVDNK